MPTIPTPCSDCKFFDEVYSPCPGESWNRCSHKDHRLETKYPCRANSYGYANQKCNKYKKITLFGKLIRLIPIKII